MAGPRQLVSPPAYTARNFGLLSVVQPRYDEPESFWRNGVTWQNICGQGSSTRDQFCVSGEVPTAKAGNVSVTTNGATPFTAFAEVDCSAIGYTQQEQQSRAVDALTRTEAFQVERAFWTGAAGGTTSVFPHLAATTGATELQGGMTVTLQCASTSVTGSVVEDVIEGIGRLEAAWAATATNGQGTLHVPVIIGEMLFRANAVKVDGAQLKTQLGNLVAVGAGYPGSGPDGTFIANAAWAFMTGPVFAYRAAPESFIFRDMFDRSTNTFKPIVERTYVLGFECCGGIFGIPMSVGGIVTGQPLSAF